MTAPSVNNRLIPLKAALKFLKIPRNMESIGLASVLAAHSGAGQGCRVRRIEPKPFICRAEGKRISFHVQARIEQKNVVLFYDMDIFPLQENKRDFALLVKLY